MKIVANTLKAHVETWTDPGDYPSGAGGGPLSSHDYLEEITGLLTLEFEAKDFKSILDDDSAFEDDIIDAVNQSVEGFDVCGFEISILETSMKVTNGKFYVDIIIDNPQTE